MTDYWDSCDNTPAVKDDLKTYIEERKKRAAQYVRNAKKAQQHIDRLQRIEEAARKAQGGT
ncbi:hypothetical protein [Nisaea sp.]|uniref:hypothetical protein n=1 Tax=Nisaea sp. TaxID=2024842 RepID=UPI0032EBD197